MGKIFGISLCVVGFVASCSIIGVGVIETDDIGDHEAGRGLLEIVAGVVFAAICIAGLFLLVSNLA